MQNTIYAICRIATSPAGISLSRRKRMPKLLSRLAVEAADAGLLSLDPEAAFANVELKFNAAGLKACRTTL